MRTEWVLQLYWHNICGSVQNIPDRFYSLAEESALSDKILYFLFQSAAPENGYWKPKNVR